jgi:HEAT repeat protein
MVLFDPNDNILRQLTFEKPVSVLAYQLIHAKHVGDREWALNELGDLAKSKGSKRAAAMRAVREAVLFDPFYGMRGDAAGTAASFNDAATVASALRDKDKRVRIAAEDAAGGLKAKNRDVIAALDSMTADPDPDVAASAFAALGALKAPGIYPKLVAALNRSSFRETIAAGVLRGLAAYGDLRAFPLIQARTAYGTPENERNAAIGAMAQLAVHAKKPQLALAGLLEIVQHEPLIPSRITATRALGALGDPRAIPVLQRVEATDSQQAVQSGAWEAVLDIKDAEAMRAFKASTGHRKT